MNINVTVSDFTDEFYCDNANKVELNQWEKSRAGEYISNAPLFNPLKYILKSLSFPCGKYLYT